MLPPIMCKIGFAVDCLPIVAPGWLAAGQTQFYIVHLSSTQVNAIQELCNKNSRPGH